jgi:hypothetical protein
MFLFFSEEECSLCMLFIYSCSIFRPKEITLVYNPPKALGEGAVVGIVSGIVAVALVILVAGMKEGEEGKAGRGEG